MSNFEGISITLYLDKKPIAFPGIVSFTQKICVLDTDVRGKGTFEITSADKDVDLLSEELRYLRLIAVKLNKSGDLETLINKNIRIDGLVSKDVFEFVIDLETKEE